MAAVFDGDPRPLYEAIEAEHADEFARSRMLEAVAMITLRAADRAEVATYLRDAFGSLRPHAENFVWHGWQSAIALLGLSELRSLVKEAFERGLIGSEVMDTRISGATSSTRSPIPMRPGGRDRPPSSRCSATPSWSCPGGTLSPEYLERQASDSNPGLAERALNPFPRCRPQRPVSLRQPQEIQEVLPAMSAGRL